MVISDKAKIFAFTGIALLLLAGNFFLLSKKHALTKELKNAKYLVEKAQAQLSVLGSEKDKLKNENEKLQADASSYLAMNSKLEAEKGKLDSALEDAKRNLEKKEARLQTLKNNLEILEKKASKEGTEKELKIAQESKNLRKKIGSLERKLKKERAVYYYNLGVAYTQTKSYEEAIRAYENSLKFDPDNADAHYNLGLLYDDIRDDKARATYHYKAYLNLRPNAPDREEIKAAIKNLG